MKLFRFNIKILLNKITVILLVCTIILVNLVYLIELTSLDNRESITNNCMFFFQTSIFYVKLIISFISIYLYSYFFTSKGDYSLYTLRMFNYGRGKVYLNKIISVGLIILVFVLISFLFYLLWGLIGLKTILNVKNCIESFICVFLLSVSYGIIGLILMQLIKNYFVMIVTIVVNLFVSGIEEVKGFSSVICFLLPKLNEEGLSEFGFIHLIWLIIVYSIIGFIIYNNRDLNY